MSMVILDTVPFCSTSDEGTLAEAADSQNKTPPL